MADAASDGAASRGGLRRPCIKCGYELAGLADDAKCPECGAAVSQSVAGDLCLAPMATIRSMATGARLVSLACILTPIGLIGLLVDSIVSGGRSEEFYALFGIGFTLLVGNLWIVGWWKLTPRSPEAPNVKLRGRAGAVIRALLILAIVSEIDAVVAAVAAVIRRGWPPPSTNAGLAALIVVGVACGAVVLLVTLATIALGFTHTRRIALLIPDLRLARSARRLFWIGAGLLLVEAGILVILGLIAEGHLQSIEFMRPYLAIGGMLILVYLVVAFILMVLRLARGLRRLAGAEGQIVPQTA